MGRYGLKGVAVRRDDALARVGWDQLERLLAEHYRREGYRVDHVGTGATGARFDGGIDLKLYRDDQYVVVQCKHWNAFKVPHNDLHQLLGLMVNEGATGAILVTSGEFTRAAVEAAGRHGHVHLVDGDDLRTMLASLPLVPDQAQGRHDDRASAAGGFVAGAAERLLAAVEDRIRHGDRGRKRMREGMLAGALMVPLLKLAFAGALLLVGLMVVPAIIRSALAPLATPSARAAPSPPAWRVEQPGVATAVASSVPMPPTDRSTSGMAATAGMSKAELREWEKRNEESMEILEGTTPEY